MPAKSSRFEAMEIPTDQLFQSPLNARRELGDTSELADSIAEQGIIEPLVARPVKDDGYEVIVGARRLACAKQLNLPVVPVVIQRISDADALVRSLAENLHRGDLSLEDRVEAYRRLHRLNPGKYDSTRGLAKAIGRSHQKVNEDFQAYEALIRLKPSGVDVESKLPPSSARRRERSAIPEGHATMLEQAMTGVRSQISEENVDTIFEQLARAIAPLDHDRARRLLDFFKMYPDRPVPEIESMALATVEREISIPAETARQIEELATGNGEGRRNWGEVIQQLVEAQPSQGDEKPTTPDVPRADAPPDVAKDVLPAARDKPKIDTQPSFIPEAAPKPLRKEPESQDDQHAAGNGGTPDSEATDLNGANGANGDMISVQYELFGSQEEVTSTKLKNRIVWNLQHASLEADFYTIGYAGREPEQFVEILQAAGVTTVVDIRYSSISEFSSAFSGESLEALLKEKGIDYRHRPDLGVPHELPSHARSYGTKEDIWSWYDDVVIPRISNGDSESFLSSLGQRVVFMDVDADPTESHRHRLFLALEREEFRGFDL